MTTKQKLAIAVHLVAITMILISLVVMASRDSHAAEIFTAALLGFIVGVLFDHWGLRPLVDWAARRDRR